MQTDETTDVIFQTLWTRALDAWDDEKAHAALLDYAVRTQQLPLAAKQYRAMKDDPAKGAIATARLDAIVVAATQMMASMKTPPSTKVPLSITLSAVAVAVLLIGLLVYAIRR